MAKSLITPIKIQDLQRKLGQKAKKEPEFRFYQLYDKVYREDLLKHAYELSKDNDGEAGVDGERFEDIEERGREEWIEGLRKELHDKTYQAQPVRRVKIPKPGGGERPLGIPTIRDRVVQTAVKLIVEPIFEADLEENAYGYRAGKSAHQAVEKVDELLHDGDLDVVDADLSKYFDTIPHAELMQCVRRRIVDRQILHLIQMWLKSPVEEKDETGRKRMSGGKDSDRGTPQGGVISPLLANLYINRMLKHWRKTGRGEEFQARIVNYADDFVILSRRKAAEALEWTKGIVNRLGLQLNEQKTVLRDARQEEFQFLGYRFGPRYRPKDGKKYIGYWPSPKSVNHRKQEVSELLERRNVAPWDEVVKKLNQKLIGWKAYFSLGSKTKAHRAVDEHVYDRVRNFLRRRHKVPSQGTHQFARKRVYGQMGVYRLRGPWVTYS